jgi:hypothetical protein
MATFTPVIWTIGTTPVTVLNQKVNRIQYQIVYPPSSKIAANTGLVYVGLGVIPNPTAGGSAAGHIMEPGESFGETVTPGPGPRGLDDVSKDAITLVASTSGQIVEVYEVISGI